jgi:PAS domain S-box-containing protein
VGVILLSTVLAFTVGAQEVRAKRVLIISTGSRFAPGFIIVDQQLLQALAKIPSARIETYAENLDIVRFPAERSRRIFSDYLAAKYAEYPPDLVILVFVGNLGISGKVLEQVFPGTPIIVAGYTQEELRPDQFGSLVSGLAQRVDGHAALELILRLQPGLRRIVVIGGTAEIDRQMIRVVQKAAESFKGRINIDFWDNLRMADMRQAVTALPPDTAILFTRMFQDAAGQAFVSSEVGQWLGRSANVPVYIMSDASLGTGAVGGAVASVEAFGNRAGELARLVLTGTDVKSLPFEIRTDSVPMFDWRALQRWGISENRLPPNSIVRFRPQSLWEHYRWYVIGALVVIILQAAIIADLLLHRRRRRRAEAELRESREMMELAASAGELGMWSRDLTGDNIWINAPMRSLFGFGPADTVRFEDIMGRVQPDDRKRMLLEAQQAQTAGLPFHGEFRIVLPNGVERWVFAKGRTTAEVGTGRNQRRMGTIIDITERKHNEQALRESEERFRTMANTAPVMIWMSGPDKLCSFFNKGWLNFTGRTLEQELGNGWAEGVHRDDLDRCMEVYVSAFEARRQFAMEYRLRRHDGEYCWVLDHGVPRSEPGGMFLGYIGTATDITEQKRARQALEDERAFLRQVIDIVPSFIFAKDRTGRFTLANSATAEAYGTTVDNLVGKTDRDFNSNFEEVEFFRRMDLEVMNTLQEHFIPEERVTDAHGKVRWLQTVKRPIVDNNGSANQVLGTSTDITQRKETELELRRQRAELAHVTRVSIMGELAASLAHELNQPLTAILSNAQAALRFMAIKPPDLEEVREILKEIVEDNSRASEVIRRMRALVKKEEIEFVAIDIESVIDDVMTLVHSDTVLHNVQISFKCSSELPRVHGDRVQLQQVILNLLLNAFDAVKDCSVEDRQVIVRAEREHAGMVKVTVRDRGTGLSEGMLDKIFQPFYTTRQDGLGMGLAICRSIIEAHGGHLSAENNCDGGATFCFTLPVEE